MSITIGHFAMVGIPTIANCPIDETANATLAGKQAHLLWPLLLLAIHNHL